MAEISIQAFVLFCEDMRRETGGKQSLLGVLGGALFVDPGTEELDKLKAVLIARIKGTRSVKINMGVKAHIDDRVLGPDDAYSATFSQDEDDQTGNWTLQLAVDLSGLPLGKDNVVTVKFSIDDVESVASLPILFGAGPSIRDSKVANEVGGQATPLPEPKPKRLKKSKTVSPST